jgi:hypothetical protein
MSKIDFFSSLTLIVCSHFKYIFKNPKILIFIPLRFFESSKMLKFSYAQDLCWIRKTIKWNNINCWLKQFKDTHVPRYQICLCILSCKFYMLYFPYRGFFYWSCPNSNLVCTEIELCFSTWVVENNLFGHFLKRDLWGSGMDSYCIISYF